MTVLNHADGVHIACGLFEIHTKEEDIVELAIRSGLRRPDPATASAHAPAPAPVTDETRADMADATNDAGSAGDATKAHPASSADIESVFGPLPEDLSERIRLEWFGFVHASVVYALMDTAPNAVVFDYLRSTRTLIATRAGLDEAALDTFVDVTLAGYLERMARKAQRECPLLFFERLLHLSPGEAAKMPPPRLAFVGGMMAVTLCCILDSVEQCRFIT